MLDLIKEYGSHGWSILPVKPDEKRPYMQNWLQYTKERASTQVVSEWFTHLSGAGVGVVTGKISGILVLDVESTCPEPIEDILRKYPTNMVSRTGSGGYHLFYQYPSNRGRVSNRVRLFDGIDLRADGGFIVLPPTKHPSGGRYEWVSKGMPSVFPASILEAEAQPSNPSAETWISELLRGVSEGGRNDAAARLAGYFFKKGVSSDIVEALLMEWNERNDPPLPTSEIRTTIKSIQRNHAQDMLGPVRVEFEDDRAAAEKPKENTFDLIRMSDYIKGYGGDGVMWAVEDWLPEKSITFLVSPPESYKTWILLDLVVSISSGLPFLGSARVNQRGPCVIIQQEDSHLGLTERLALIANARMGNQLKLDSGEYTVPLNPDLPIYIHPSRLLRFDNPKVLEELEKCIAQIRPRVVMIDPLYSATSVDNYMAQSAEQMMVLKSWRDKYGCSFIIAHHSKKNTDPDSTAREDAWGSQFLNAFLEAGWQIRRSPKLQQNQIIARRHSKVMGNLPSVMLTFDISTRYPMQYAVAVGPVPGAETPSAATPAQSDIYDILKTGNLTQAELVSMTGKNKSTISRQIKQLEVAGSISKMPNGAYQINPNDF